MLHIPAGEHRVNDQANGQATTREQRKLRGLGKREGDADGNQQAGHKPSLHVANVADSVYTCLQISRYEMHYCAMDTADYNTTRRQDVENKFGIIGIINNIFVNFLINLLLNIFIDF